MLEHVTVPRNNLSQDNSRRLAGVLVCFMNVYDLRAQDKTTQATHVAVCFYKARRVGRYMIGWVSDHISR